MQPITSGAAFIIACISLYSTGHWIGGTVCLIIITTVMFIDK